MLTSISGRSVIVTGASKGIGKGIARVFANQGAKVLVVSRTLADAEACANEIGNGASAFSADVGDWDQCQAMATAAQERHGGLDILCANAGVYPQTNIEEMDPSEWDLVMGTNLKGNFLSVKACLPALKNSDQGRVILTSNSLPQTGREYSPGPHGQTPVDAHLSPRTNRIASGSTSRALGARVSSHRRRRGYHHDAPRRASTPGPGLQHTGHHVAL